jgi:penicillin amidase
LTLSGNTNDRFERLAALLAERTDWDIESVAPVQRDTYSASSHAAARAIAAALAGEAEIAASACYRALAGWDGRYDIDSRGALAYQGLLPAIIERAYAPKYGEAGADHLRSFRALHDFVAEDVASGAIDRATLVAAAAEAERILGPERTWGDLHRIAIRHTLGSVPFLGGAFRYGDIAAPGSSSTVQKSAHDVSRERHLANFGSQSRHLSDLADPDANWFVLLGGQDGWLGSECFIDQVPLWERGELVQIPMRRETVEREYTHRMELVARAAGTPAGEGER